MAIHGSKHVYILNYMYQQILLGTRLGKHLKWGVCWKFAFWSKTQPAKDVT